MRIDPSNGFAAVGPTATGAAPIQSHGGTKPGVKVDPPGGEDSTFTPTADLARLLDSVRRLPEVRPDAVAGASDLVASGELLSSTAATDTAQAILNVNAPGE